MKTPASSKVELPLPVDAGRLLRGIEWRVLRRLDGLLHGDYRGLVHGPGDDFAELREYQPQDDVRHIDWNVTARLQVPHVRRYLEDRELNAWFLVDLSASADTGAHRSRATVALEFVALMAALLTRRGNRVGALRYRHGVDAVLPTGGGRRHLLALLHRLAQRDPAPPAAQTQGATRLHELLQAAEPMLGRRRAQVFVVSDFHAEPGWEVPLARLARHHEVLAVRLTDPFDGALPDLGLVLFGDAESGEQMLVDTGDWGFRRRHAEALARREAALQLAYADAGVDALELATEDDLALAITRFVQMRRRVAQRQGGGVMGVAA